MNKLIVTGLFALSATAFADTTAQPEAAAPSTVKRPCQVVRQACQQAGFEKGIKGKRLWRDCMKPIMHGESVPGVTVDPSTLQACQAHKGKHHFEKKGA